MFDQINTNLINYGYAFLRCMGFVIASPVFIRSSSPGILKVILALAMAVFLGSNHKFFLIPQDYRIISLAAEIINGLLLGFAVRIGFFTFSLAGGMIDFQGGFSMSQVMDPSSGESSTLFSSFFELLGIVVFLSLNGHIWCLKLLDQSFYVLPFGNFLDAGRLYGAAGSLSSFAFMAVKYSAPLIFVLLLNEVFLGFFSRIMPGANLMILGQPIRFLVAVGGVSFLLYSFIPFCEGVFGDIFNLLNSILAA